MKSQNKHALFFVPAMLDKRVCCQFFLGFLFELPLTLIRVPKSLETFADVVRSFVRRKSIRVT